MVLEGQADVLWEGHPRRFIRRRREDDKDGLRVEGEDDASDVKEGRIVVVRVAEDIGEACCQGAFAYFSDCATLVVILEAV